MTGKIIPFYYNIFSSLDWFRSIFFLKTNQTAKFQSACLNSFSKMCVNSDPQILEETVRRNKRKQADEAEDPVLKKQLRIEDYITYIPNEILLRILSYLSYDDLFNNARLVCKKWNKLCKVSPAWRILEASPQIPTRTLCKWIEFCNPVMIKHLHISGRNDADVVLKKVSKHCPNLEALNIENCWGSMSSTCIRSKVLCNLLLRCHKLQKMNFEKIKIRSCKFFQLLATRRSNQRFVQLCYVGPVSTKQYNALKDSCSGWVFTEHIGPP